MCNLEKKKYTDECFFERKQDVCLFPHYYLESISKWQGVREITSGNKIRSVGGGQMVNVVQSIQIML